MRNLLKKSRQFIISKSGARSYVLYSVGEIVLVVIGILIALSINNWNEDRKDLLKEQQILNQLKAEYKSNLLQLEEKIAIRETSIKASQEVLMSIDNEIELNSDSLIARLAILVIDPTFDPIVNDLIGSGNIRLIRNDSLKRLLTNWSSDVVALQELERRWTKLVDELVVPFYIQIGVSRDVVDNFWVNNSWFLDKKSNYKVYLGKSSAAPKVKEVLVNRELEGILSIAILLNQSGNVQSYTLRNRIQEILNLLDKEINQ